MALYAIGDLHLSLGSDKPMEIFGDGWKDYVARIREGFSVLTEDDVTVLCGDLSWGMSLVESLEDFRFIDALPEEVPAQGQPRLLVEHRRQNGALFRRKRPDHHGDPPQQLPVLRGHGSVRYPGLVL